MGYVRVLFLAAGGLIALVLGAGAPLPPSPALAVPANDNFANAVTIATPSVSGIVASGSTLGATTEAGEPVSLNCPPVTPQTGSTVWFEWTSPASTGTVMFDTIGSNYDTVLAVYTGTAVNGLTPVVCNDDFTGFGGVRSFVTLNYEASTTYRIQLGGFNSGQGDFVLSVTVGRYMFVNSNLDTNTSDTALTLREAMLMAVGGTGSLGLNRALSPEETNQIRNLGDPTAPALDHIRFTSNAFPVATPATIAIGSTLPNLSVSGDVVSGVGTGVRIQPTSTTIDCIHISGSSNHIEGLQIQSCADGILILGPDNVIGGALSVQRNVFGGGYSGMVGIRLSGAAAARNVIKGNFIGTNAAGTAASVLNLGIFVSSGANLTVIGGSAPGEGNVISGAGLGLTRTGIIIQALATQVVGNKIGTNPAGTAPIPNDGDGIAVWAGSDQTVIGGLGAGEANLIAFNTDAGVSVEGSGYASIRGNSIHSNTGSGIAAVLASAMPAPPAVASAAGGVVTGTACALCTVDIYDDAASQGRIFRATTTANAAGDFSVGSVIHTLANVTALASNVSNSTSVFSVPLAAPPNADGDGAHDGIDLCAGVPEDPDGFQDGDGCPESDNDLDGICDAGQASVSCTGSDSGKLCFDPAGTLSCGTKDCRNIAEDYDAFKDGDGCPEPDNDNDGKPDTVDTCPGTGAHTGADSMLGAPEDLNHNGIRDNPPEALFTNDDVVMTFEDYDGVLDTDGCHDSPGEDFDSDGYTDDDEALKIGTNPGYPCGNSGWPSDLLSTGFSTNKLDVQDIISFVAPVRRLDTSPPGPPSNYHPRWDLAPGANFPFPNHISIFDITTMLNGVPGSPAYPPMFGGPRAFLKDCPLAPQ